MDNDHNSIIEVFSGTLWEAEMIKSLLQDEEILSFLKNAVLSSYAFEPIYTEGVKVMISESDFVRAKQIVDGYNKNMQKSTN